MSKFSRDIELEKQMDAYVKGYLSEEQGRELWKKLLKRPEYIELLETELGVKAILEKQASAHKSEQPDSKGNTFIYNLRTSWKWIAAAAFIITMIISVSLLQTESNQPIQQLVIKEINLRQHLITASVTRSSQSTGITPADSLLNLGFKAAIGGDIDHALRLYEEVTVEFAHTLTAVQAHLNIGMIHYNRGDFREAASSFNSVIQKALNQPVLKEKAYWYLSNAYINQGELSAARDAIRIVHEMDGIYSRPSFRLLKMIDEKLGTDKN